jgi:hypothetical protein
MNQKSADSIEKCLYDIEKKIREIRLILIILQQEDDCGFSKKELEARNLDE